jgi:hypothetical protein
MPSRYEDREKVRNSIRSSGLWGDVCWFLSVIFAILGIIGDAINATLGLEPMSWFLLAVVALLTSVCSYIGWVVAWYLQEKK